MVESQPDYNPYIQSFQQWARDARCATQSGDDDSEATQYFIPNPKLEAYLRVPRRVSNLLEALFPETEKELPVEPEEVRTKYCRVFVILLLIGKGEYIINFVGRDSLCDRRLPFESKPSAFPIDSTDSTFFQRFQDTQWELCAPCFDGDGAHKHFEPNEILPIIHKQKLAGGGLATTYQIRIHEAYNHLPVGAGTESGVRAGSQLCVSTVLTFDRAQLIVEKRPL